MNEGGAALARSAGPEADCLPPRPLLIGSDIYRRTSYVPRHPLAIPRVSAALDPIRAIAEAVLRP